MSGFLEKHLDGWKAWVVMAVIFLLVLLWICAVIAFLIEIITSDEYTNIDRLVGASVVVILYSVGIINSKLNDIKKLLRDILEVENKKTGG